MKILNKEIVRFDLDFAKMIFNSEKEYPFLDSLFWGLSANSNITSLNFFGINFDCMLIQNANMDVLILNYNSVPVIHVEKIKDTGIIKKISHTVIFYGLFFMIEDIQEIFPKFLKKYSDQKITRIDLALDIPEEINAFLKKGIKTRYKKSTRFGENLKTKEVETVYFGAKGCTNKRHFIRVYNKLKDTEKKSKMQYYLPYFEFDNVTRIELQMNSLSCNLYDIKPLDLLNKKRLTDLFHSCCINPNATFFKALSKYKLDENCRSGFLVPRRIKKSEILDQMRYAKTFLAYGQTLFEQGFDVYGFLSKNLKNSRVDPLAEKQREAVESALIPESMKAYQGL